jgi:trimeric autotransporter adhesin
MTTWMHDRLRRTLSRKQLCAIRISRILLCASICALALLLASCGDFFVDATLTSVIVTPSSVSIGAGNTTQLTAIGEYDGGSSKRLSSVTWSSSNSDVATVSDSGLVQGVSAGTVTITASKLDKTGTASAIITLSHVDSIVVAPSSASIRSGETQAFSAIAFLKDGTSVDVTDAVIWKSSNTTAAKISSTGIAVGNTVNNFEMTNITATSGAVVSNKVVLAVSP